MSPATTLRDGEQELLGRPVSVSNADKVLFPDDGITKGQLIAYYERVAPIAFRYLEDRPIALRRFPDGIAGSGFFQKHASGHLPDWVGRIDVPKREGGTIDHVVASEPAVLPYLADQAAIELHPWSSTASDLEHPDQLVFDLDPAGDDVDAARRATRRVGDVLQELGLPCLLKTSGSKGYHVHVVLDRSATADETRALAADVASLLARRHPDELTDQARKASRHGRVLVDYLRNGYGQTAVAPYSVRARAGAPVAAPIAWDELGSVDPRRYTITNLFRRLGQRDDPWAQEWGSGTALDEARRTLEAALDELD